MFSETFLLTRATECNIPKHIQHSFFSVHLQVTADVHSSLIRSTLMMEAILSSETSVLTRATRRNIPEDTILHNHRRETLKSYN
jgi:hypothetical protein